MRRSCKVEKLNAVKCFRRCFSLYFLVQTRLANMFTSINRCPFLKFCLTELQGPKYLRTEPDTLWSCVHLLCPTMCKIKIKTFNYSMWKWTPPSNKSHFWRIILLLVGIKVVVGRRSPTKPPKSNHSVCSQPSDLMKQKIGSRLCERSRRPAGRSTNFTESRVTN